MGKFILFPIVLFLSGFSQVAHTALLNVASVKFTVSPSNHFSFINLNEVILTEKDTGNDLALASNGAEVVTPVVSSNTFFNNNPEKVIDGVINKKYAYYFLNPKKWGGELPSLTINLAQLSDINSFNIFGYFGKAKTKYLGVDFLDAKGNSIYEIANLAKTFGNGNTGTYILPDLSGQAAVVPLPTSAWLFGFGMVGIFGMARKQTDMRSIENA